VLSAGVPVALLAAAVLSPAMVEAFFFEGNG
jgi:hypothetical protein